MVLLVHQSPYYDTPFTRYTAQRNAIVIDQIFLQIELPEKRWTQRNYHHLNEYNLKVFMFEQMVLATNGITPNFGERVQTYSSSSSTYNQSRIKYLLSATFSIIFVFVHFLSFWRLFFSSWPHRKKETGHDFFFSLPLKEFDSFVRSQFLFRRRLIAFARAKNVDFDFVNGSWTRS